VVGKFKVYNEDFGKKVYIKIILVYHNDKNANFDNLYEEFLKGKYDGLVIFTDSEEDVGAFQTQVRSFQSSYKQFLKHKRSHNEVTSNF
jgi:hypothetical protein